MFDSDRADAYFATRTIGAKWLDYSTAQRKTALMQAQRDLERALGHPLIDDEAEYEPGDTRCYTYAVYEQAAYALMRDAAPNATSGNDIPTLGQDEAERPAYTLARGADWLSAEARRWLGVRQQTRIARG